VNLSIFTEVLKLSPADGLKSKPKPFD